MDSPRTTVKITQELLTRARLLAIRDGTTLKALLEEGLRYVLRGREHDIPPRRTASRAARFFR